MLEAEVRSFCSSLGCGGVLLCTDDPDLKEQLRERLEAGGLRVASHDALLSSKKNTPSHKDISLDRRLNAEDVLVEALLMSRCHALLSTWSNVSVAAVYFAPPGYAHFLFGDAPPPRSPSRVSGSLGTPAKPVRGGIHRWVRGCRSDWRPRHRVEE